MPASSPTKDKGSRPQKFAQIGELGRITGVEAPKNVPRDSGGYERPEDFFNEPDDDRTPASPRRASGKQQTRQPASASARSAKKQPANQDRHQSRPDKYLEVGIRGRKTGIRAPSVQRDEDGFEDVDAFFKSSPASARSSAKKRYGSSPSSRRRRDYDDDEEEEDEDEEEEEDDRNDGTETMDFDDGTSTTPRTYQRQNASSSSKKTPRQSGSSPARQSTSGKKSVAQAGARTGSSALAGRRVTNGQTPSSEDDDDDEEVAQQLGSASKNKQRVASPPPQDDYIEYDDYGGGQSPIPEEEEDEQEDDEPRSPPRRSPERGRARDEEDDQDEDQRDSNNDQRSDSEEDQENRPPGSPKQSKKRARKGKGAETNAKRSRQGAARDRSEQPGRRRHYEQRAETRIEPVESDSDQDIDGLRRSNRRRVRPLEYWRNERVIYKKRPSGIGIEGVVRVAKDSPAWPKYKRNGSSKPQGNQVKRSGSSSRVKSEVPEEDGIDDMTDEMGIVWNWEGDTEVKRRIAFTAKMVDPRPTFNSKFSFQKIYTELDYMAAGILQIPAGIEKPPKPARDNSYMFYCIEGSVMVTIHRTRFAIGPGGTFFVPRGNMYSIMATSNRDVKLFFTQGRRVYEAPDGTSYPDDAEHEQHLAAAEEAAHDAAAARRAIEEGQSGSEREEDD